jgi:lysophospholipase
VSLAAALLALLAPAGEEAEEQAFRRRYEGQVLPYYRSGLFDSFPGSGGVTLRYACFPAGDSPDGLVILPGKSESYIKYAELVYDLEGLGLAQYVLDHRGMGFSERLLPERRKVHVESFDCYVEDLRLFLEAVVRPRGHRRLYLLGHSMGGVVAASYLEQHPEDFAGAVLTSPAFAVKAGPLPPGLVRVLAFLMDRPGRRTAYGPGQEKLERRPFESNIITHSRPRWQLWERELLPGNPAIQFGGVTRHWLREFAGGGAAALRRARSVRVPVLLLQAGEDRLAVTRFQDRFCRRAPACRRVVLPGSRHEMLIEKDSIRRVVLAEIRSFLRDASHLPGWTAG